jgi:adenylate cyclase
VSAERQARRRLLGAVAIGAAAAAVSLTLWLTGSLDRAEHLTWDWRVQQAARPSPTSDSIALVLVDQPSLDWGRQENAWPWPWPREVYTALVDFCRRAGARTITFDVLFTEPSLFGVDDDRLLGDVLAMRPDNVGACFVTGAGDVTWPIAEVRAGATRLGNVAGHPDADGVVRRAVLAVATGDTVLSSLGLATYELAEVTLVPEATEPRVLAYAPTGTYAAFSAAAVIQSELRLLEGQEPVVDPVELRGKHVFVGFSAPGLLDQRPTPLSRVSPGVMVHATVLDNLLAGRFMTRAPVAAVIAAVLLLSVLAALLAVRTASAGWQLALFVLGLPLPLLLGLLAYGANVWWPVVPLTLGIGLALVGGLGLNWATEGRQRRFLKQAFRHYLSPHVIDRLVDDPSRLQLGGERRTLSIFFSDLAGFTSLGERLDAESLTTLLNLYLSAMTDIILEEGGTLDKYEGDAIIAFWNAPLDQPDHALRAARTAVRCQQELEARQEQWRHHAGTSLSMRIGVHTGPVVVGNLGSRQRFDYTVLGDAANLASRLEGANKVFGTGILLSEATMQAGASVLRHRELGRVQVVGRSEPVTVFELDTSTDAEEPASWGAYRQALELVRAGQATAAFQILEPFADEDPAVLALARRLGEEGEFRGLWRLDSK